MKFSFINSILSMLEAHRITYMTQLQGKQYPVIVEKDEDGWYIADCPIFSGCYTQGKTIEEALQNIKEVIEMCLEEEDNHQRAADFHEEKVSFHFVKV